MGSVKRLHVAAQKGLLSKVKLWLDEGDDIDAPDPLSKTPLKNAVDWSRTDVVRVFLEAGTSTFLC